MDNTDPHMMYSPSPRAQEAMESLTTHRQALRAGAPPRVDQALELCQDLSDATDACLRALMQEAFAPEVRARLIVCALGGYGRQQLCLHSDLDVLIEHHTLPSQDAPALEEGVERLMHWVRGMGVKLSHVVRTPQQGVEQLPLDIRTPLALLDARALHTGDLTRPEVSCADERALGHLRGEDDGLGFVEELIEAYLQRRERHGQTIYLLEPDIKAGPGGLRDMHVLRWAQRVRQGAHQPASAHTSDLTPHLAWMLWLRHHLHAKRNRRHDRLRFQEQEHIARHWEGAAGRARPVEALMRAHYEHARAAQRLVERGMRALREQLPEVALQGAFWRTADQLFWQGARAMTPQDVFDALELASARRLRLHASLERAIVEAVGQWSTADPPVRDDARLQARMSHLLTGADVAPRTAKRLLELGILGHMMPEFEPIICHVQHDVYHVYTTDQHSLYCLEMAREVVAGEVPAGREAFGHIARGIEDPSMLFLAALTHDIGKNRGGGHSVKGARMAPALSGRMGWSPARQEQLSFLIREHLCLSNTARRKDISDVRVARTLARTIRTTESLNLLTTLTFCDMSTVGPAIINDWNAALLLKLHERIKTVLERGEEQLWRDVQAAVEQRREALWRRARSERATDDHPERVDAFLRTLPAQVVATTTHDTLWAMYQTVQTCLRTGACAQHVSFDEEMGVTDWIVVTQDDPGTLVKITAAFAACGLDILTADLYPTSDGLALDRFRLVDQPGAFAPPTQGHVAPSASKRARAQEMMSQIMDGHLSIDDVLATLHQPPHRLDKPRPTTAPTVRLSVDPHRDFTHVEVTCEDRPGLLFDLARTLHAHHVNTNFSKIDSQGHMVVDTFYVEHAQGGALPEDHARALERALQEVIQAVP